MVYRRMNSQGSGYGRTGGFGSQAPVPRDIIVLLAIIFSTFSMRFFELTGSFVSLLMLSSPQLYHGQVWRLATYPYVGLGAAGFWFLIELLMIFWFGRDIFWGLGRRRFWRLLLWASIGGGLVAAVVQGVLLLSGTMTPAFLIMQGQRMVWKILIIAYATMFGERTIMLFFVIPLKARWFTWLTILFSFMSFLGTHDFAGFIGIVASAVIVVATLTRGGGRELWRSTKRRLERLLIELRLARLRRQRRHFDVFDGGRDDDHDRWVH